MAKNKNRKGKFPGLSSYGDIKVRHELYDQDYVHKLSDSEKQWLSNFNMEYISADFEHDGKRLHKKKLKVKKIKSTGKKRNIDVGKEDVQNKNNARNRDAYSVTKANRMLESIDNFGNYKIDGLRSTNPNETEDTLITLIDKKNMVRIKKE